MAATQTLFLAKSNRRGISTTPKALRFPLRPQKNPKRKGKNSNKCQARTLPKSKFLLMNSKLCTCKAGTRKAGEEGRWMDGWVSSARTSAGNNPQEQMLGCVGVNECKCIHEPALYQQLAFICGRCCSPCRGLASCQLRRVVFAVPGPFFDLLPRGYVGGWCVCVPQLPDESGSMFCNLQVLFHFPFRPAVDIF